MRGRDNNKMDQLEREREKDKIKQCNVQFVRSLIHI